MDLLRKLKERIKNYREMYRIWRSRPLSTFKEVSDIFRKRPILNKAYDDAVEMLRRDQYMFNEVCTALFKETFMRKSAGKKRKDIISIIAREDQKINAYEQNIRKGILDYLAENSAPDVKSSLILTSMVIDLERLGDYTKDLAKVTLIDMKWPTKKKYSRRIEAYRDYLMDMFNLTISALENGNKTDAKEVMHKNISFRKNTDKLLLEINQDKKVEKTDAMVYTLLIRFFRRVSAHLENVASSVVAPFPYLGFKRRENAESSR